MEAKGSFRSVRIAGCLLAGSLITAVSAIPQSAPAQERKAPDASPASAGAALNQPAQSADGLRDEIREVSAALRQMHDELEAAPGEARQLKQELQNTRDQVMAIKTELAAAHGQPNGVAAVAEIHSEHSVNSVSSVVNLGPTSQQAAALQLEQRGDVVLRMKE